jgi:hypothetical protein
VRHNHEYEGAEYVAPYGACFQAASYYKDAAPMALPEGPCGCKSLNLWSFS